MCYFHLLKCVSIFSDECVMTHLSGVVKRLWGSFPGFPCKPLATRTHETILRISVKGTMSNNPLPMRVPHMRVFYEQMSTSENRRI